MLEDALDDADAAIGRIRQEIRGLGARHGWGPETTRRLREQILASQDEDVKRFLAALEPHRPRRAWGQLLVGVGELVLGAFLTVAGLILVVPAIVGFTSREDFARYLADLSLGLGSAAASDPAIVALGFGFALFLLLAALYTLRQASRSLRESGVVPPTA
ncbi:MAG TPA: hypothetical protein VEY12_06315 [Thermoplasmata archaeon]|nr:hypothetical protein [Thermoplasmata archaeon]